MWRTLSLVIVGFWAVMTSLLVRYVWFPEGTQFAEVPPSVVLREFLEQSSAVNTASVLHIHHGDEKIGEAYLRCIREPVGGPNFVLFLDGYLDEGAVRFADEKITWQLKLKLLNGEQFGELFGRMHVENTSRTVQFLWPKGQRAPKISVHGAENAGVNDMKGQRAPKIGVQGAEDADVNDMLIQLAMAQALAGADAAATEGVNGAGVLRIRARESAMNFAGQKSEGYLLELTVMDRWKARIFITEAGEFVLMDLPEGYRLVEPVIHGLAPDYDAEEDEEQEKKKAEGKK